MVEVREEDERLKMASNTSFSEPILKLIFSWILEGEGGRDGGREGGRDGGRKLVT